MTRELIFGLLEDFGFALRNWIELQFTFRNLIELGVLAAIIAAGFVVKRRTAQRIRALDEFNGICRGDELDEMIVCSDELNAAGYRKMRRAMRKLRRRTVQITALIISVSVITLTLYAMPVTAYGNFAEVDIKGTVNLSGDMGNADIVNGMFEFSISGYGDGFVLPPSPVSVRGGGEILFGSFDFYGEGEYFFEVHQVDRGEDGFVYDTEPVKITVTITQDESGNLTHRIVYERGGFSVAVLKFYNTYAHPAPKPVSELAVTKKSSHIFAAPGDSVTYTITVKNVGNADAVGVRVREYLPRKTLYVSHTGDFGKYGAILGREHVTWFIGTIKPEAEVTVSVTFQVNLCIPKDFRLEAATFYEITGDSRRWGINDPIEPANATDVLMINVQKG
ncbi:MAG: hypothetical protein FWF05_05965 [Oscillospiraceae bacterium]|nr:hypothetical protein [Oscillospiraceae bacterium]